MKKPRRKSRYCRQRGQPLGWEDTCPNCHGRGYWYSQRKVGKKIYPIGPIACEICGSSPFSRKYQEAYGIVHRNFADDILEASTALDKVFLEDIEHQVASKARGRRKHEKTKA